MVNFLLGDFSLSHLKDQNCWTNAKNKNAANATRNMIASCRSYQSQGWNEPGANENLLLSVEKRLVNDWKRASLQSTMQTLDY